jgi:O-antigen/teichoic acid export membrane protein
LSYAPNLWRPLLEGVVPLAINAFAVTLSLRAGQVLLMSMRGPLEVGLLAAASRVAEAFTLLPEALMITIYPLMASLHGNDRERLVKTAGRSTRYLVVATGVPVVVCVVASREVMSALFGPSFAEAGTALAVLAVMALFGATGTVILNLLIAAHHEHTLYRNTLLFALVNAAACVPLIRSWGYLGAAVTMLASSAASQLSLALLPSTGPYVRPCLTAGAAAAAAVCLAAAAGRLSGLAVAPASLVALVCYAAALVLFGVVNRDEIRFVRTVLAAATRGGDL